MKLAVVFQDDPSSARELTVYNKLGRGKFDVFYAKSLVPSQEFAVKYYSKEDSTDVHYRREKTFLASLDHPNIIKSYPISSHSAEVNMLFMEYAPYGDFFEVVTKKGLEHDVHIRTYFYQLIEGIEHMHSKSIAHLDLKLENLLLGKNFELKIIDFDGAQLKTEKRQVYTGTNSYRALEVLDRTCTDRFAADIFAAGVILYAFKACCFPFVEVEENGKVKLSSYDLFVRNNEKFWKTKAKDLGKKSEFFSADFKKLLNGMLAKDPKKRMTLTDIKASEWYNKPILCPDSLKTHMDTLWRRALKKDVTQCFNS